MRGRRGGHLATAPSATLMRLIVLEPVEMSRERVHASSSGARRAIRYGGREGYDVPRGGPLGTSRDLNYCPFAAECRGVIARLLLLARSRRALNYALLFYRARLETGVTTRDAVSLRIAFGGARGGGER